MIDPNKAIIQYAHFLKFTDFLIFINTLETLIPCPVQADEYMYMFIDYAIDFAFARDSVFWMKETNSVNDAGAQLYGRVIKKIVVKS